MNRFSQSTPKNLVISITGKKVHVENMSDQMIEIVKRMGAFRMTAGDELVWLIECADENELIKALQELNRLGFLFIGGPSGYPAADMFVFLLERKKLSAKFKEIRWRGPGDLVHY